MKRYVNTEWEVWSYDVWGNEKEGYEVNDRSCDHRHYHLRLEVKTNNAGTDRQFDSAFPADKQIRQALSIKPKVRLEIDGDDVSIYVRHASTGYPLGEMFCNSHDSLSEIKEKNNA